MSRLSDLIAQIKAKDPQLGADLDREYNALASRRSFGLNFERHRPEAVELPLRPIRKGDKVRVLPERGSTKKGDQRLWVVQKINKEGEKKIAALTLPDGSESQSVILDDLIVVAEFKDTIYPGLISTGKVSRGGGKPYHTVINGENYHVLEALTYTHRGKIDAIYIDPPYNTGAKDWKYNNDYVEGEDLYRHSKWLAMMERRLLIAKDLLNPSDSVLIATIDEKEYLRLGLLLEQIFPEAKRQMVTVVIQAAGSNRKGELGRVEEYAFFLFFGSFTPHQTTDDLLNEEPSTKAEKVRWESLLRSGTDSERKDSPNLFYPVYLDKQSGKIIGCGESKTLDTPRQHWIPPKNSIAIWPIKNDGKTEGRWRCTPATLTELVKDGFAKAGPVRDDGKGTIWYLGESARNKLISGEFAVTGIDSQGAKIVTVVTPHEKTFPTKTVWNRSRHHAGWHGTNLISNLIPGRGFPFPKSLYSVEDALRVAVGNKSGARILDFFAGSGTTAHAVMRLNKQDGGFRQCISITNNEVGADEQKKLREKNLRPGDPEWEQWGICDYITKPRVAAAITGKTPEGQPIKGDYKFTDEFPMAEGFEANAEFFTLTYENPVAVNHNRAFERIAPLLWLRAGSVGRRIEKLPSAGYEVTDTYGLLTQMDCASEFLKSIKKTAGLRIAYVVTDDERRYQALAQKLPQGVEPVRLYESYLTNFAFANGNDA
jgi:adenine-specific DNA-methyltransferase